MLVTSMQQCFLSNPKDHELDSFHTNDLQTALTERVIESKSGSIRNTADRQSRRRGTYRSRNRSIDEMSAGALLSATPCSEATPLTRFVAPALSSPPKRRKADRPSVTGRALQCAQREMVPASGTVIEDVLYAAGSDKVSCSTWMTTRQKHCFKREIISDPPPYENRRELTGEYLDKCTEVASIEDMKKILEKRQYDPECKIIYYCIDQ
ncbi:hypothetical protein BGZ80_006558, partial [Entomortierella chlamydospora]